MANFLADDQQQDVPAAGGMASLFPPLPQHETHSTSESGSSAPVAAPEYTAAMNKVGAASQEQADTTEAKGQVESDVAQEMADEAKGQLAEFDKAAAEKAKISAAEDVKVRQASDYLKKDVQSLRQTPAPALFHDGDGWKNIAKAVALAVAGFGDALAAKGAALGGRSPSQNSVSNIVNMLVDQEKAHVQKLTDNVAMSKTGLADAKEAKATLMAAADAKGAEAMRRVQMLGDYMVKSKGPEGKVLQARLDALNTQQDMNKFQAQSLQSLNKTITGKHSTENIDRDQTNKPGQVPTTLTDELTGKDLPVDPTKTSSRQHTTAVGKLASASSFIQIARKLLDAKDFGPPEIAGKIPGAGIDASKTADLQSDVIAARRAYAPANGESINAESEKSQDIIPDAPTSLSTHGAVLAFHAKLKNALDKINIISKQELANAGVPHDVIAKARPEPATSDATHAGTSAGTVRTATNPQTGEKLQFQGGKWVPM